MEHAALFHIDKRICFDTLGFVNDVELELDEELLVETLRTLMVVTSSERYTIFFFRLCCCFHSAGLILFGTRH